MTYNLDVTTAYLFDGAHLQPLDWQPARALRWAAWRPDGASLLAVGNGGSALSYDGTKLEPVDTGTRQNLRGAAWSPDGAIALLVGNRGAVLRLEAGSATDVSLPQVTENLRRVAWHPGGEWALIVGNGGSVLRYDRAAASLTPLPGDRAHTLRSLAFRPDGAYALVGAFASRWAGYPRPAALYRCDGRYLQALLASDDEDDYVAIDWTQDGLAIACGYAWRNDGVVINKALLYDGSAWRSHVWGGPGAILGGGWKPGGAEALLVGENGLLLRFEREGSLEELDSETKDNLIGPFWKPDGSAALILKGPGEKVYTV